MSQRSQSARLPEVTIYTDGACSPNPGPGGWGAVLLAEGKEVTELSGYGGASTNNRMELTAAVQALASLDRPHRVELFTDSQYLRNGITSWIAAWQQNDWRTAARQPVKNSDLWQELLEQIEHHEVSWKWVRGHGTSRWNNRADELAVAARKSGGDDGNTAPQERGNEEAIHLYPGVTCKHKTGIGAWAVILAWKGHVRLLGGRTEGMTANQLYVQSVIAGLECLKKPLPVRVYTHSGYLHDGATRWLAGWKRRDWRTREGTPISNRELWQRLAGLLAQYQVDFVMENRDLPSCGSQEAKELAREWENER